ncbi:MAG TPA: type 1 glutamine amidotransferase domain-containing protein [Candidatus Baltobacteraceae bacterium]|nr:type 1 glutamine amidotransferase domain-containing protein [Candidatus Baltobacteraceae bacterium]
MATSNRLEGMTVAILAENRFEQSELLQPREALDAAGAKTVVVSPQPDEIQGMNHDDPGQTVKVDLQLDRANADDFDALLLPGGVVNPDRLRMNPKAMAFVRAFVQAGKPIAAICHGPWSLVEVDAVRGKRVTSWPSLQTDIRNAGGTWVDEVDVTDQNITTSRKPDDIPQFNQAMISLFEQSRTRGELRQTAKV